jgi:hypothetical protein
VTKFGWLSPPVCLLRLAGTARSAGPSVNEEAANFLAWLRNRRRLVTVAWTVPAPLGPTSPGLLPKQPMHASQIRYHVPLTMKSIWVERRIASTDPNNDPAPATSSPAPKWMGVALLEGRPPHGKCGRVPVGGGVRLATVASRVCRK